MIKYVLIYVLIINVVAFAVYGIDKHKAKKSAYRIPEKTLFILAIIGGSIGALLGMKVFHHKTLHKSFSIGIPFILIAQIILIVFIIVKFK